MGPAAGSAALLWATPERNPARTPALRFRAAEVGRITVELFDVAGRRLHREERTVSAGESGTLRCSLGARSGIVHYRVALLAASGGRSQIQGMIALVR